MADSPILRLFGFEIARSNTNNQSQTQTFIPPPNEDGALNISSAAYYGTYVDLDGTAKNEIELITRYREMSMQPEVESAIDDVINEAIVQDDDGKTIKIILDDLKDVSDRIKSKIEEEFDNIQRLLNYNNMAQEIFRRWYVDGRIFYNIIIDKEEPAAGIKELRYIDPRKIRKIRELKKTKDANTGVDIVNVTNEYYIYNDKIQSAGGAGSSSLPGIRIAKDSVINVNSGLMDARRATVLSYLHKAIKPLNQLRMIEDASVIYRISRAPERRIFYIDVGNLPKAKAEQYLNDIMAKYKNKLVYDSVTGQVRDDRKHLSMLEDFWLPRREGGKGTEIDTLSGGENLGVMEDVIYFEKKLYKSLSVPPARLNPQEQGGFNIGRSQEISRDELKFAKFISRLRNRFSDLFDQAMRVQLTFKGICTPEEWDEWKEHVHFDYIKDNYFTEFKEAEIMTQRLSLIQLIDPYTGRYYSENWVRRKILRLDDDEIKEMEKEIKKETKQHEMDGTPYGMQGQGQEQGPSQDGDNDGIVNDGTPQQKPAPIDPVDKPLNSKVMKFQVS